MSRTLRVHEPHQPPLPLGHGLVHWETLPPPVRERVLALWLQLLLEHQSHQRAELTPPPNGASGLLRDVTSQPEEAR